MCAKGLEIHFRIKYLKTHLFRLFVQSVQKSCCIIIGQQLGATSEAAVGSLLDTVAWMISDRCFAHAPGHYKASFSSALQMKASTLAVI